MRFLLLAAALAVPALAHADDSRTPDARQMHTDDCARARKANRTCVIDMGKSEDITANSPTAGGSAVSMLEFARHASLVHIRQDFIVEILKTAEDL